MALMNHSTNEQNIRNLIEILPHWYLSPNSHAHVAECIIEPPEIATSYEMDSQYRIWHPVPESPKFDIAFREYNKWIRMYGYDFGIPPNMIDTVSNYSTWESARLPSGQKLFKWLAEYLNNATIEAWTTSRNTDQKYICLSKNPIDFLYMATNQSHRSCMGLKSSHSQACYMGYPEIWADHYKYIMFLTTGKLRTHTIKGREFKHFRMLQRSFAIHDGKTLGLVRQYPQQIVDFRVCTPKYWKIDERKIKTIYSVNLLPPPVITFEDNNICRPYNDCYRLSDGYALSSSSGCPMVVDWDEGFESMQQLEVGERYYCDCCENLYPDDETRFINDERICDSCVGDYFYYCDSCNEYFHRDSNYKNIDDQYFCEYCANRYLSECANCGESHHNDNMTTDSHGNEICKDCLIAGYYYCDRCNEWIESEDTYTIRKLTICTECIEDFRN